jgi:hypothetical protein
VSEPPLATIIRSIHLFCDTEEKLVQWGEDNKDEIHAKLNDFEQARLRQEYAAWRTKLRTPDGGPLPSAGLGTAGEH